MGYQRSQQGTEGYKGISRSQINEVVGEGCHGGVYERWRENKERKKILHVI